MMPPNRNDCVVAVLTEVEAAGFKARFEYRGKHAAILWDQEGKEQIYFVPLTPSDHRAHLNCRAEVRRLLNGSQEGVIIEFRPRLVTRGTDVYANSRDVAEAFDKRHDNVLRDVDNLLKNIDSSNLRSALFEQVMVADAQGFMRRSFDMTRDGFALLAMGFSGQKALRFKLAYIEAFNAMDSARLKVAASQISEDVPAQIERLRGDLGALTELVFELPPREAATERVRRPRYICRSEIRRKQARASA